MIRIFLALAMMLTTSGWARAEGFRFVALPDTQRYSEDLKPPNPIALDPMGTYRYFVDQTRWIVENAEKQDLRYVIHLGDIVQDAQDSAQWERALSAMNVLHKSGIPYGTVVGNHDLLRDKEHVYDAYLAYFGPRRFEGKPWFGGASPRGTSNYQVIRYGDYEFLFMNLSYATPRDDVAWANDVLAKNRDKVVIVSTHAYLWDMGIVAGRYGEDVGLPAMSQRMNRSGRVEGGMMSQEFYESFVNKHPNILMVLCGHSGLDWYRTDGVNGAGKPVIEALTDYQVLPNGGEGYLRIYEIDPEAGTLTAESYSPTKDRYRTPFENFVQLVALGFSMDEKAKQKGKASSDLVRRMVLTQLKRDVVPETDVVGDHPDYAKQREHYRQLFTEMFQGPIPGEAGLPEDWEAFWMRAFASDPKDPANYDPNERSPSFTIKINLDDYISREAAPAPGDKAPATKTEPAVD